MTRFKVLVPLALIILFASAAIGQQTIANGYRLQRNVDRGRLATHGQMDNSPRQLTKRGVTPAANASNAARASSLRAQADLKQRFGPSASGGTAPAGAQFPIQTRTWRATDDDLARAAHMRAFNLRFQNRILPNGTPNYGQLRSRVSQSSSDPRTMNTRLGQTKGATRQPIAPRYGSSRVRAR